LAKKTKCRIILDESNSLGLISFKGGLAKKFELSPSDIDIIIGSFSNNLGSVGGYSVGSFFVTDHQVFSF
jgi:7-keto-8-aminopelargonate synthetase-like enzyme